VFCWCARQVWDRKDCVTFVSAWLRGLLLKAQADGRATIIEEAPAVSYRDTLSMRQLQQAH